MPIVSKYDIQTQQRLLEAVIDVFDENKVPADLALMTLGNAVSNVINATYQGENARKVAEQFGQVLLQSLDKQA